MKNRNSGNKPDRNTNNGNMMSYTLIIVVACYFIYIAFTIFVGLYRGDREVHWYHILIAVLLIIAGVGAIIYTYKKYRAGEITNSYPAANEEETKEETSDETAEGTPDRISEKTPEENSDEISEETSDENPDGTSRKVSAEDKSANEES